MYNQGLLLRLLPPTHSSSYFMQHSCHHRLVTSLTHTCSPETYITCLGTFLLNSLFCPFFLTYRKIDFSEYKKSMTVSRPSYREPSTLSIWHCETNERRNLLGQECDGSSSTTAIILWREAAGWQSNSEPVWIENESQVIIRGELHYIALFCGHFCLKDSSDVAW